MSTQSATLGKTLQRVSYLTKYLNDPRWVDFVTSLRERLCRLIYPRINTEYFWLITNWKIKVKEQVISDRKWAIRFVRELVCDMNRKFSACVSKSSSTENDLDELRKITSQLWSEFVFSALDKDISDCLDKTLRPTKGNAEFRKRGKISTVNANNEPININGEYYELSFKRFQDLTDWKSNVPREFMTRIDKSTILDGSDLVEFYLYTFNCFTIEKEEIQNENGNYRRWKVFDMDNGEIRYYAISRDARDPNDDIGYLYPIDI